VSIVAPSTIPLHADGTRVTVVRDKHASATVGFVRLTGAIAALFVVLLLFRSRGRRRRAEKSAKRKLADQREPEHSYRR
jgi:C4-dicarboxylate-specific signal transduction histidine kinase